MSSKTILKIRNKTILSEHLIIFSILCIAFVISFLIRIEPLNYGWELNEFDPFFNYRATEFILENGVSEYFDWNDELSWYPQGRDIERTSQVFLHIFTAYSYSIFGGGLSLYDFTILFPAIIGSLTCFVIYGISRNIFGNTAGLLSALFFSISIPILVRGYAGWFKSEPLGIFLALISLWLFFSSINELKLKNSYVKIIFSAIFLFFSLSAWGGNQFFLVLIGAYVLILPFTRNDNRNLIIKISLFTISLILLSFVIAKPGIGFIYNLSGLSIILPSIFLILCIFIKNKSSENNKTRNSYVFLIISIIGSIILLTIFTALVPESLPSYRYLNSINPFLTSNNPLVDSIAEHTTTTINSSFLLHNVFLIFSGIGVWLLFRKKIQSYIKNDKLIFTLVFVIFGAYMGSSFSRLEVLTSISLIIISSIGISILLKEIFTNKHNITNNYLKIIFCFGLLLIFIIPITFNNNNVIAIGDIPPVILTGGTNDKVISTDWNDALLWMKNNTPKDSIIASWWDYGYWIQTKGERTTLVDNATLDSEQIKKIANALMSSPEVGWKILSDMEADYFVLFVSAEKLPITGIDNQNLFLLQGGGDESKKFYFITISEKPVSEFLYNDAMSGNQKFWNQTLLGQLIPFSIVAYVNPENSAQFPSYESGTIGIYEKNIKFKNEEEPFSLVYSSPGFSEQQNGLKKIVLIYKINKTSNFN